MDETQLAAALGKRPWRYFASIGSTNDAAADWLRTGAPAGAVVLADEQFSGRGRMGRPWRTPPGSALAVSIVLMPPPERAGLTSMVGALAVCDMCTAVGARRVGIKWPNDVQIEGRKVSGILPEAIWGDQRLLGVVLGIGVNIRVPFDEAMVQQAINLESLVPAPLDRVRLVALLLEAVDAWAERDAPQVVDSWQKLLTTLGRRVRINGVEGMASAVDGAGALLVTTDQAETVRVVAGDVLLV